MYYVGFINETRYSSQRLAQWMLVTNYYCLNVPNESDQRNRGILRGGRKLEKLESYGVGK